MDESREAEWLRTHWSPEFLGQYRNNWIAVVGNKVILSGESLEFLMSQALRFAPQDKPLYAYVYFGDLQ
jgi:hypothetical protein